jgi:hypothetical protein
MIVRAASRDCAQRLELKFYRELQDTLCISKRKRAYLTKARLRRDGQCRTAKDRVVEHVEVHPWEWASREIGSAMNTPHNAAINRRSHCVSP